ncbi:MAG: NAD-dependent epimerase/dehydratase family protein, partial [Shewanella sp.]
TVLEGCRQQQVEHLVYASSSSVYGLNQRLPFSTQDSVDHPISLYAATKKANELMAHSYSHLYQLPTTGLRFFTVYGPWGRPDMALFKFTQAMLAGEAIDVYHYGALSRDFTYIDDIVEGIIRVQAMPPSPSPGWSVETGSPATSSAPYRVFNIGYGRPVALLDFITALEAALGIKAKKRLLPMQPGDVPATWADTEELFTAVGYQPQVDIHTGVARFVEWYRHFYQV